MKKHLLCGALLVFALSIGSFSVIARASSIPSPLTGWAWSSNVGWISFSSTDSGTGDGGVIGTYSPKAYGVYVSTTTSGGVTTGTFSGYAWSPNVGWISFNASDLDSSPVCLPGGSNNAATANLTTGSVTGYARVLSGVGNSIWDGCIELSGNNHASPDLGNITINGGQYLKGGVTFQMHTVSTGVTQGLFGGFGWDSGVLGWINFASGLSGSTGVTCPGCGTQPVNTVPALGCTSHIDQATGIASWIATVTGGAGGPYVITWDPLTGGAVSVSGDNVSTLTSTFTQNAHLSPGDTATAPAVSVTDKDSNRGSNSCSPVSLQNNANTGLKLMIAHPGTSFPTNAFDPTAYASLQISKGQKFNLGWNANLPSEYLSANGGEGCSFTGSGASAYSSGLSLNADLSSLQDVSGLQSGSLHSPIVATTPGRYSFALYCLGSTDAMSSIPVYLNVVSSSEGEL